MDWILDARLRIFHAAARYMSFIKAAEALYITQPGVSFQIRSLEEALGAKLFKRSGAGLELTELGKELYKATEELLHRAAALDETMAGITKIIKGTLHIAVSDRELCVAGNNPEIHQGRKASMPHRSPGGQQQNGFGICRRRYGGYRHRE
ncbi:MAG TPA: LysR family transcriptional regulator [Firmicutes bacterium]|nr:LysR family transcriptional regulator [Bacillota bacterium]